MIVKGKLEKLHVAHTASKSTESQADKLSRNAKRPQPKGGSRKGVPNRATADVRTAIAKIAEQNVGKLSGWLTRIARKDPARAMELYLRMIEYHIPKLTRTEIVKDPPRGGRVIDSSQLTAEQREQLRQMILGQPEVALIEQQPSTLANFVSPGELEPAGLGDAQVIDNAD